MWTRNSSWHSITPSSGHHRRGASPYIEPSYSNTDSSYPRLSIYTCNLAEVAGRSDLGRALPRRRNATDCNGKEKIATGKKRTGNQVFIIMERGIIGVRY